MSVQGKWRIVEMPDYESDYPDMMEPAYILFDGEGGGEFAFGCVTGAIHGAGDAGDAVEFTWDGNDEMDEACGGGWAELAARRLARRRNPLPSAATKSPSSRAHGPLLQQPARAPAARPSARSAPCPNRRPGRSPRPIRSCHARCRFRQSIGSFCAVASRMCLKRALAIESRCTPCTRGMRMRRKLAKASAGSRPASSQRARI